MSTHSDLENLVITDLDAGLVFSGSPSGRMVKGYAERSPFTPAVNPHYIFHEQSRDLVVWLGPVMLKSRSRYGYRLCSGCGTLVLGF